MLNLLIRPIHHSEGAPSSTGSCAWGASSSKVSSSVLGLLLGLLVLTGCQGKQAESGSDTAPTPQPTVTTAPETTSPSPEPTPTAAATPSPEAPKAVPDTVASSGSQLPDTLVKGWEPESNVLFEFGAMTISANQISWSSGQSSQYSVVGSEGGYLLKLDPVPSFFDTANPYIKLIPQASGDGAVTEVEVAFYETEQKAQSDEYIMFGTYMAK